MECEVRSSGFLMHSDTQNLGSSISLDSNPSPITSKFYDLRLLNSSEPWFPSLNVGNDSVYPIKGIVRISFDNPGKALSIGLA